MANHSDSSKAAQFSARVLYVQPEYYELYRQFSGNISPTLEHVRFNRIHCCWDVSRETRVITFELLHLGHEASYEEVLAEMDKRGLRPALYEELLAFTAKYPDEHMKGNLAALGSELSSKKRAVIQITNLSGGRRLGFDYTFSLNKMAHSSDRFLAVPKNA